MNDVKIPKLRFKGEDGTEYPIWKKDKWSALGDFVGSGILSKADLAETGTPCILYGELYTKYGEIAHTIYSKTSATSHTFSKADDVILPKSGETPEDISTATCIPYDNISLGGDLIVFRHNEKVIGSYLSYLISNRAKNAIASIAQGKSVVHISEKSLANIELAYPCLEEQKKIADFLSTVDEVIVQSEKEVKALEQQKKGAMQKIFSQEVRFKREDGTEFPEWKEKALQDVSHYITTTGTGVKTVYVGTENMQKGCTGVCFDCIDNIIVKGTQYAPNDILISNIRPYLKKTWRADRNGICSTDVLCIRSTSVISSDFLYTLLSSDSFFEYVMQGVKGTKMPRGDKKHIMEMPVFIPCLEEQQKIADFLSAYDEAITNAKAELNKWKELKKGLLQQMFV